jgi:hypothetical protein
VTFIITLYEHVAAVLIDMRVKVRPGCCVLPAMRCWFLHKPVNLRLLSCRLGRVDMAGRLSVHCVRHGKQQCHTLYTWFNG